MSEIIAGAFVRVQAELIKGFRNDLQDSITKGIGKNPLKVPVRLDVKAFRGDIQRELRKTPFGIPVRPEMSITKFRSELHDKVKRASKGVTVTVPVLVGGGPVGTGGQGGGTGGAGTAGARDDAAEKTRSLTSAEKLYQSTLRESLTYEQRSQRLTLAMADAKQALRDAVRDGNVQDERAALALRDRIRGQQQLQTGLLASGKLERDFARAQKEASAALGTNLKNLTSKASLTELDHSLTSLSTRLTKLNERATELNAAAIRDETAALQRNIATRRSDIASRRDELGRRARETSSLRQGARGAGATGLAALGARGATLAAGSEFLIGAAAVAVTAKAIGSAANLESELNVLRITARASREEMEKIRATSVELGRDIRLPGVSATDAAQSMSQLVRAGLSVEDALDGARGVLQLATAAQIEFADSSALVASALNAFSLAGSDAVRVADLLTNAANESQGEITDIGTAMQQSAGAASAVGVNLEDTVTLLTLLSRAGLSGSDAGTSLRTAFIRLVNPTKKAAGVIEELGLRIRDSQGRVRPEVFAEFEEATENLSNAQRDAARAVIFGQDAFRASALIGRQGTAGFNDTALALERQGAAAELAGARAVGLSGQIAALQSNLETLGTTLGSISLGPLTLFVGGLNDLVTSANEAAGALKAVADFASGIGGDLFEDLPGPLREVAAEAADIGKGLLGPQAGFTFTAREIRRWSDRFRGSAEEVRGDAQKTTKEIEALFKAFGEGPLKSTAINEILVTLDAMADKLSTGDVEAQRLATAIRGIIEEIKRTQQTGGIDVEVRLDRSKIRRSAQTAGEQIISTFRGFGGLFETQVGGFWIEKIGDGMKKGIPNLGAEIAGGLSLETQRLLAEAAGNEGGQLSALRSQLAAAQAQQARQRRLVESGDRPDLEDELQATTQRVINLQNAINSILDDQKQRTEQAASEAKQKADDAVEARRKLDEAVLAAFDVNRQRAQNKIAIAEATAGLDDDIKATAFFKRLVRLQISRLKERVKTAEIRNEAFRELSQILFGLNRELEDLRAERRRTMRDEVRRGIELDIAFAETTENRSLERRSRQRLIASLQKEINDIEKQRKLTIEQKNRLKELRNEIAEQRKALGEVQDEREKILNAHKREFEFLQTIQGFTGNLLGNLIPGALTGGLVGGTTAGGIGTAGPSIGGAGGAGSTGKLPMGILRDDRGRIIGPKASTPDDSVASARAASTKAFTAGQGNTTNQLLRKILAELHRLNRGHDHPEAKHQRKTGAAAGDYGGGGSANNQGM